MVRSVENELNNGKKPKKKRKGCAGSLPSPTQASSPLRVWVWSNQAFETIIERSVIQKKKIFSNMKLLMRIVNSFTPTIFAIKHEVNDSRAKVLKLDRICVLFTKWFLFSQYPDLKSWSLKPLICSNRDLNLQVNAPRSCIVY